MLSERFMLWHRETPQSNPRSRLAQRMEKQFNDNVVKQARYVCTSRTYITQRSGLLNGLCDTCRARKDKEEKLEIIANRGMKHDGYGHSALVNTPSPPSSSRTQPANNTSHAMSETPC